MAQTKQEAECTLAESRMAQPRIRWRFKLFLVFMAFGMSWAYQSGRYADEIKRREVAVGIREAQFPCRDQVVRLPH